MGLPTSPSCRWARIGAGPRGVGEWIQPVLTHHPGSCQLVVESSAQRLIHLASQWEKHRVPLLAEYRHLRKLQDCREVSGTVLGCECRCTAPIEGCF